jgi:hypothetical protein
MSFRVDIADPVVCQPTKPPAYFSFETTLVDRGDGVPYPCGMLSYAVGHTPRSIDVLISEEGLRMLARAALATANELQAVREWTEKTP